MLPCSLCAKINDNSVNKSTQLNYLLTWTLRYLLACRNCTHVCCMLILFHDKSNFPAKLTWKLMVTNFATYLLPSKCLTHHTTCILRMDIFEDKKAFNQVSCSLKIVMITILPLPVFCFLSTQQQRWESFVSELWWVLTFKWVWGSETSHYRGDGR